MPPSGKNWMTTIHEQTRVRHMTVPGSHDAGVSKTFNAAKGLFSSAMNAGRYICQDVDIAGQLAAGARFFDIRFGIRNDVATTEHQTAGFGGWGEDATSIFQSIDAFLAANTKEFVMLRISHTNEAAGLKVFQAQQAKLNTARTFRPTTQVNIANTRIGELRGKAVVAYAKDAIKEPDSTKGQIRFGKTSKDSRGGLVTCGTYPNSNDMALIDYKSAKRTVEHKALGCNHGTGTTSSDHLFMLYWQMTGGNVETNTKKGAAQTASAEQARTCDATKGTHYNLRYLLESFLVGELSGQSVTHSHITGNSVQPYPPRDNNRFKWVPNIINLDFLNEDLCMQIAEFTFRNLRDGNITGD